MGLTKQQKWDWERREDRKRREYNRLMEKLRQERAERLTAIGMLLDAKWDHEHQVFVKIIRRTHANGLATHFELFYNELGEEVPRPKGYRSA